MKSIFLKKEYPRLRRFFGLPVRLRTQTGGQGNSIKGFTLTPFFTMLQKATHFVRREERRGGFTLIETLVAIFILVVSIGGPLTIVAKGLSASFFARDQITAFFLAQEAVEYVRNIRDRNTFEGNGWIDGFASCFGGNVCDIDVQNDTVISCSGTCPALLLNSSTGFFNHVSGNASPFVREVALTSVNADEVVVTVTMSWRTGALSRSFVIKEHIFNWQQGGGGAPLGPVPCGADQAEDLVVSTAGAGIGGPGRARLNGITLSNTCATASVTISEIQISWGNGETLERIRIDGNPSYSGPSQPSGPFTDIANYTVAPSAVGVPINFFEFSGDMRLDTFTITFLMLDGSSDVVGPLSP